MLDLRTYRDQQVVHARSPGAVPRPARSATPSARSLGKKQLVWLRDSLMRTRPQWKIIGNPVMIAPVNFGALPDDLIQPINDVTGLRARGRRALQHRPVGRLHRRPRPGASPHRQPRRSRTRCS